MVWAKRNGSTSGGLIPANVAVNARAMVTAGFANDVEDVNQYAAGGDAVGQERQADAFGKQPLRHDSGANHCGDEEAGAQRFCDNFS
jgi:hypothetical protein